MVPEGPAVYVGGGELDAVDVGVGVEVVGITKVVIDPPGSVVENCFPCKVRDEPVGGCVDDVSAVVVYAVTEPGVLEKFERS